MSRATGRVRPGAASGRGTDLLDIVVSSAPFGFGLLDAGLRYVRVNEYLADINGLPAQEHVGRSVRELLPALADVIEPLLRRVLDTGEPVLDLDLTDAPTAAPGHGLRRMVSYYPTHGPAGAVTGVCAVVVDVSERTEAMAALRLRARRQACIAELGQQALGAVGAGGVEALFDRAVGAAADLLDVEFVELLELAPGGGGLSLRAGVGWRPGHVGHRVDAGPGSQPAYVLAADSPVTVSDLAVETRFSPSPLLVAHGVRSGVAVAVRGWRGLFGVVGAHSRVPRAFGHEDRAFLTSIANILGALLDRRLTEDELRSTGERLHFALDAGRLGFWEWVPDQDRMIWSPRLERILGVEPSGQPRRMADYLAAVHADDRAAVQAATATAVAAGSSPAVEHRIVRDGGAVRWVEGSAHAMYDADGRTARVLGLAADVTERREAEHARAELYAEIERSGRRYRRLASTLQRSLLPPRLPSIPRVELAASYQPGTAGLEVGGDFYDVFPLGGSSWGLVMGDVCGKGPEAASLTALARYTVRAAALQDERPSRTLAVLNEAILRENGGDSSHYVTLVYARLQPGDAGVAVELSSGGHPLPLVRRRDGRVETLGTPGTLIGLLDDPPLFDDRAELRPGDVVVLFTDGVTDAGRGRDRFGEAGVVDALGASGGLDAAGVAQAVMDAAERFGGGAARDDRALLVARVLAGGTGPRLEEATGG